MSIAKMWRLLIEAQSLLNEFRNPDMSVPALNIYTRIVDLETRIRALIDEEAVHDAG